MDHSTFTKLTNDKSLPFKTVLWSFKLAENNVNIKYRARNKAQLVMLFLVDAFS